VGGGRRVFGEQGEGVGGAEDGEVDGALQLASAEAEGESGDEDKSDEDADGDEGVAQNFFQQRGPLALVNHDGRFEL